MTISIKHKFNCLIPDATDDTQIRPSNWNDDHDVTIAPADIGAAAASHDHDGSYVQANDARLTDARTPTTHSHATSDVTGFAAAALAAAPAETATTIKAALGITTLSGSNTGDQDLTGLVHSNRTALDAVSGINSGDHVSAPAIHASQHTLTGSDPLTANPWHGVVSRSTVSPLPTSVATTTFTLACGTTPLQYYYKGKLVTVSVDKTVIFAAPAGKYFIYFTGDTAALSFGTAFPNQYENVLVASVIWNGSNLGLVADERHGYRRNIEDHIIMHEGIGTRYVSGGDFSFAGTTNANTTFSISAAQVNDEDIRFAPGTPFTTARIFYQIGVSEYAFLNALSTKPYWGGAAAGNGIYAVNAANYAQLTITNSNRYFNYFVYHSTDVLNPIYILAETTATTAGYTSAAAARAVPPPQIGTTNLSTELKLFHRIVVNGAGLIQTPITADDYRSGGSIPGGGISSTSHNTLSNLELAGAGVAYGHVQIPITSSGTYLKDDGTWGNPVILPTSYRHIQSIADTIWLITHNLDKYPTVTIRDSSLSNELVYGTVKYIDSNRLTIEFAAQITGEAYLQ